MTVRSSESRSRGGGTGVVGGGGWERAEFVVEGAGVVPGGSRGGRRRCCR